MRDYKLNELVRRAKGSTVILPKIEESAKSKNEYIKALREMLRQLARKARDAKTQYDLSDLANLAARLSVTAEGLVARILGLEASRHTATFKVTVVRTIGVDLSRVVLDEDLGDYLQLASSRNASLIKNLGQDAANRMQQSVVNAWINGDSAKTLSAKLTEDFGIADRRAQLIAQDQMAKLNSDMNRIRHEQAGVTEYIWRTSSDERVRPRHKALDGKTYRYGERTGAEDGLAPGQPIRCRCVAMAVVEF